MSASEDDLSSLHKLLSDKMKAMLDTGEFTSSDLNVIRAFLKDNGIEAESGKGTPLGGLAGSMPDLDEIDGIGAHPH